MARYCRVLRMAVNGLSMLGLLFSSLLAPQAAAAPGPSTPSQISPLAALESPAGDGHDPMLAGAGYLRLVRTFDIDDPRLQHPAGLAFSPDANLFFVSQADATTHTDLLMLTPFEQVLGSTRLQASLPNPVNVAFDRRAQRLLLLDTTSAELLEIETGSDGRLEAAQSAAVTRYPVGQLGLQDPRGMALDPVSGHLWILDSAALQLVRIRPDAQGGFDGAAAVQQGRVARLDLPAGLLAPRGLAFHPGNGHLYLVSPSEQRLYELSGSGQVLAHLDLAPFGFVRPQALLFAPSGDPTDDPSTIHLYLTDSGLKPAAAASTGSYPLTRTGGGAGVRFSSAASTFHTYLPLVMQPAQAGNNPGPGLGRIVELSLTRPVEIRALATVVQASLVRTTLTSQFSPPSPDPAGIVYLPGSGRLLISDSEVNEMPPYFAGKTVFETTRAGALLSTFSTLPYSGEPTGLAYDRVNGHLFISDDDWQRIFELNPGADGLYGTPDDSRTYFDTDAFGCMDPEGITFDTWRRHLFIADGTGEEAWHVAPGANGVFDGAPPAGDDQVSHFDVTSLGIEDPEGIEFNPDNGHLYIMSAWNDTIAETLIDGTLVRYIDISPIGAHMAAGLAYAPASANPAQMNLYIVDRAIDNNENPNENDGKLYEVSFPDPGGQEFTVDSRVEASADDATERASGDMFLDGTDLDLGYDGSNPQTVGMRFDRLAIPPGSIIVDAYVQFQADETGSAPASLTVEGEDADNAATFTSSAYNISSRARTTASVDWPPAPWTTVGEAGPGQRTPNIGPVIQEIVNRPGWSRGNSLAIFVSGSGTRVARSYDGIPAGAPLLHVVFRDVPITGLDATNDSPTELGQATTLTATVTAGSNVSYAWAFGDGQTGSGAFVSHTYPSTGTYTAVVTATNSRGEATDSTLVTIVDVPIAGLNATDDSPTELGQATTLTATVTTGSNVSYVWAFGDGQTGSGALVTHTYPATGAYTAVVTATNSHGEMTDTTLVTIVDVPIAGLAATDDSPTELGQATTLTATVTAGTDVSYAWDFGDDQTGSGALVTHTYPATGAYTAVVTATNSRGEMTDTTLVTIVDVPIAGLNATDDSPTELGQVTTLTATVTAGSNVSYAWAFGDGQTGDGAVVIHTYPAEGVYTAMVTASNPVSLLTATTTVTITPTLLPPGPTTLISPAGVISDTTPSYTWHAVERATWYKLMVEERASGTKSTRWVEATGNCAAGTCTFTQPTPLNNGEHIWWVQTYNDAGYGPWSAGLAFWAGDFIPPATPVPVAPVGANIASTPTYTWQVVPTATWYQLYVSGPLGTVTNQWVSASSSCGAGSCSVTPSITLHAGPHAWWVRAWSQAGLSPWSTRSDFFVGPPLPAPAATLIAPSGTIAATTPAYTWGVVPSATWYWLYVVEKPSNTPVVDEWYPAGAVCDGALGACAVTPTLALQDGAHSWWVKTWNPYDGAWSQNLNFTVAAGAATPLAQEVSGQQLRLYLPLVLKRGGTEEAPQPPGQELPPGVDGEGDPPVEERTPPAAPPPDIDAETGPPVVELAPSAGPPPEANEADGPPRPIR